MPRLRGSVRLARAASVSDNDPTLRRVQFRQETSGPLVGVDGSLRTADDLGTCIVVDTGPVHLGQTEIAIEQHRH